MRRNSAGFSLLEVVVAMAILAIAIFGMISVITYSSRNNAVAKERMLAIRAAEKQIEIMKAMAGSGPLRAIYTTYSVAPTFNVYQDSDPSTPNGVGTVALSPNPNINPPPPAGQINFPGYNASPVSLREDLSGAFMGRYDAAGNPLNIDMDQDGIIDGVDKSTSATLAALPVQVVVTWKGIAGPGQVVLNYVFCK